MSLHLFREVKSHGKGDPADDSESWSSTVRFYLVPDNKLEEFCEHSADESSSQDYSYRYSCKEICKFADNELFNLTRAMIDGLKKRMLTIEDAKR